MFDFQKFDPNGFKPSNAFEGWVFAKIQNLEKNISNHLSHHTKIEIAFVIALLSLITGLIIVLVQN